MSGSSAPAPAPADAGHVDALANHIGQGKVKFTIKTGGKKYECVMKDRVSHEREKLAREKITEQAPQV